MFISVNFQHSVVAVTSSCMFRAARRQEDDLDLPYSDTDALNITQVSLACCETGNINVFSYAARALHCGLRILCPCNVESFTHRL